MLYITIFLLNLLDILTTYILLTTNPTAWEANPFIAPIIHSGWLNFILVKITVSLYILYTLWKLSKNNPHLVKVGLIVINTLYIIIVLNNLCQLI